MLKHFLEFIRKNKLFTNNDRLLLAISGGLDSMVMLTLLLETDFKFSVAHANFKLRGEESDGDEAFIKQFCEAKSITIHTTSFETSRYAEEKKISIQMAARELRYVWFRQLTKQHGYSKIVTAHHLDDQAETIFLNMVKGEGLNGLTGMPLNKRNVVRPLMFATKDELEHYARNTHLKWREDSTNKEDNYHRNFIRHQIFPRLHKINPGLNNSLLRTSLKAKGEMLILKRGIEAIKEEFFRIVGDQILIQRKLFESYDEPAVLWRLLDEFGFSLDQAEEISLDNHQSGKIFLSPSHRLVIDRENLILQQINQHKSSEETLIIGAGDFSLNSQKINCRISTEKFTATSNQAWLNQEHLQFPLVWRTWQEGDRFMPLGMTNFKKVSDFLIDVKLSLPQKENVTVVVSAGEIVWVVGLRIDDRFKQKEEKTSVVLSLL